MVVPRSHAQLADLTADEVESVIRASRALISALRAEGLAGVALDQVGPASGVGHYSVIVGARQGSHDEIDEFVNGLRAHL
jgi:hypothetical protein